MKKSVSLKEFSTTPTVSYMLRKDGSQAAAQERQQLQQGVATLPQREGLPPPAEKPAQQPPAHEQLFEME